MPVPMPAAVVLIVCKTVIAGPEDQNSAFTGYENREWATENSMMVCRRQESADCSSIKPKPMGAQAQPFNQQRCQRSAIMLGSEWDASHQGSSIPLLAGGVPGSHRPQEPGRDRGHHRLEDA